MTLPRSSTVLQIHVFKDGEYVGADVFVEPPSLVSPSYATAPDATTAPEESLTWGSMEGGNGIPRPPD